VIDSITQAEQRIRPWIVETPLVAAPIGLFLKLEHLQHTGSFKARGAFNKLLTLPEEVRARGVIAASTGNHGAAVAYAAGKLGVTTRIVVPEGADPGKLAAIRALGGRLETHGDDSALAERFARAEAERLGIAYVSPYNDLDVVAGQGTLGLELLRRLPRIDAVFIALGGGGLLAGVAAALKAARPGVKVIACSPENSAVMIHSIRAGRILELESKPTLSDGTAGGVEPGAITFDLVRALADDYELLPEEEIRETMLRILERHGYRVEGAAAVAVAGYLRQRDRWQGAAAVAILCGGNVNPALFGATVRSGARSLLPDSR
jgi:threonine dehydratase